MLIGITVTMSAVERGRLKAIVGDRNAPQTHVSRPQIVLLSKVGIGPMRASAGPASRKPASGAGRSAFRSSVNLQTTVNRFLEKTNDHPKPFIWSPTSVKSSPPLDTTTKCYILSTRMTACRRS